MTRSFEPFINRFISQPAQCDQTRGHRERVSRQRPCLVNRTSRCDVVHDVLTAAISADGQPAPVTAIVGLAGDRPDDTLRGVGKLIASRVDRFVQKEMLHYLRGRTRESVLGEIRAGAVDGGWKDEIPVYIDEPTALAAELDRTEAATRTEVIVLLCHEDRESVYRLIAARGLEPVNDPKALARLVTGA